MFINNSANIILNVYSKMPMLKINIILLTSGFIGPQILNFERSISLSPGPQNSLVPPYKISLGGPGSRSICICCIIDVKLH